MTRTMTRALGRRIALGALALAPLAFATRAAAQSPTPEGTTITNTATASWTDANNNSYAPVSASAAVTVGFAAGPDVASQATAMPASPSTNNQLVFTLYNRGNGTDEFTVRDSAGMGVVVTGYTFNGIFYPTFAGVNAILQGTPVAAGDSIKVTLSYTVNAAQGGNTIPLTLTATSVRDNTKSDFSTTLIQPPVAGGVAVTPDNSSIDRLPSNGTQYSDVFTVTNNGNTSDNFSLVSSVAPAGTISIVSTNGLAGTSGGTITLAAGASQNVTVVYTVAGTAATGSTSDLRLAATSGTTSTVTDMGDYTVRVVRPAITMTKVAYRDDQSTAVGSGTVRPGEHIQYRITVTNGGSTNATTVAVSDPLPTQVTYEGVSADAAGWAFTTANGTVSANLSGALAPGASRFFHIRVVVK